MKLREYRKEDAAMICKWVRTEDELYRWSADRFNKFPLSEKDIEENYAPQIEGGRFFPLTAVNEEGIVVGHFIIRYPREDDDSSVRFGFVIVDPEIRGKGYGSRMLWLGIQYVKDHLDVARIDLGVFEKNEAAKRCYEAVGFREYGLRKCEMPIGTWNCIDMELNLAKNYRIVNKETYYRNGVFRHFTEDCKCSTSMTARIDVTDLVEHSRRRGTRFYINFLYVLSKVLNSRDDYKMGYLWQSEELICYDSINPIQYVFHEDTETCTPVYTRYYEDYEVFYRNAARDVENAKQTREYGLDMMNHPNWFDASYISWLSYDSLNIELPDGYLHFAPIINWGKYREENGRLMMPVSVRLNHAIADGFLVANVYRLLEKEMAAFCG
ncbi:MAG: GNAT family N-acetyltransferase [Eubacterium sp.]|nr:GNAT family N-acetyltransferase [Eubacterium sp.]